MKLQPLISIIIPIHNTAGYLERCIESVRNQTLKELEIILVDNLSIDESPLICDEYEKLDSRIKVLHLSVAGPSVARNAGIKIAPILVTYAITPNNIFTWNALNLSIPLFDIPQRPKESIYPIYRTATNIGEKDREPGTYFIRVKTPSDIEYGINLTKETLAPFHGLYEELDLALRQAHEYQQETIEM